LIRQSVCRLTVCVTGAGASEDSILEQEKLEASLSKPTGQGKILEKPHHPPAPGARFVGRIYQK